LDSADQKPTKRRKRMKIQEIRKIAKQWGVDARVGRSKQDINPGYPD
jgi:hypothetical protein